MTSGGGTQAHAQAIESRLRDLMAQCADDTLREAMSYSLLAGGKRLRPRLLLAACEAVGGMGGMGGAGAASGAALDFACAAEMIHSYSLIHDDLPAMDDSDLRRGKPTCHVVYGEALAILAGDGLLSHAMETMSLACADAPSIRAMRTLARAVGVNGMVAGQVRDMVWEGTAIDADALKALQAQKTMALIAACVEAGGILGGGTDAQVTALRRIGRHMGRAFQIKDDLLDIHATAAQLGKPVGSDGKNHKNTYVTVLGAAQAESDYACHAREAREALSAFGPATPVLAALLEETLNRAY